MNIYAVHDIKAEAYLQPFFAQTEDSGNGVVPKRAETIFAVNAFIRVSTVVVVGHVLAYRVVTGSSAAVRTLAADPTPSQDIEM